MKDRDGRLRTIKHLIRTRRIRSQDILLELLEKYGHSVTQATLSRDLKLLKVGKISDGMDGYHYTIPGEEEHRESEASYVQDLVRGWLSIDFSANIGVIRTMTGHADSVALALDNLQVEGILGTVAGDDTIIVVLDAGTAPKEILDRLRTIAPEIMV